jgi:hypothetical protein
MNKNLLALSVASASALAFSASAAVSSNIVGYVKLNLATGYNLVANPLNNTNTDGNTIGSLFGTVDCSVSRWTGAGFTTSDIVVGAGVIGDNFVLAPGEAVFVNVTAPASVTLVGEALIGTQSTPVAPGNNFVASKIPLSGTFTSLGLIPSDGATVSTWTGTTYQTWDYVDGAGYIQQPEATVAVGQGLVVNALTAFTWTKSFTPQ